MGLMSFDNFTLITHPNSLACKPQVLTCVLAMLDDNVEIQDTFSSFRSDAFTMLGEAFGMPSKGPSTKGSTSMSLHTGWPLRRAATLHAASVACTAHPQCRQPSNNKSPEQMDTQQALDSGGDAFAASLLAYQPRSVTFKHDSATALPHGRQR